MPRPHYEDDVTFDPTPPLDLNKTHIDRTERPLHDGETQRYIDGDKIVTRERINGKTYETSTDSDNPVDKISNISFTEDSLGSQNVTFEFGDNNIICRDDSGNIRAKFGQIATGNNFGLATYESGGSVLMNISGNSALLAGWTIGSNLISKTNTTSGHTVGLSADTQPRLELKLGSSVLLKAGMLEATKAGFQLFKTNGTSIFKVNEDGADISGWKFDENKFQSDVDDQARIELDGENMRVTVVKSDNSVLTAMGYLGGLVKNNSIGNQITVAASLGANSARITIGGISDAEDEDAFNPSSLVGLQFYMANQSGVPNGGQIGLVSANTFNTIDIDGSGAGTSIPAAVNIGIDYYVLKFVTDDYGFWAAKGDQMRIDGDVEYDSGDWLIHSDGALKFSTGAGLEVMRLGTHTGKRGLFIGSNLNSDPPLAQYTGSKILIGDESNEFLRYTTAGGLEIAGDITVTNPGDTSTMARDDFKAGALDTGVWTIIGNVEQNATATGIGLADSTGVDSAWDSAVRWSSPFQREHAPSFYWDVEVLRITGENTAHMMGWFKDKTTATHINSMLYGVYFTGANLIWRHGGSNNYGSTNSHYAVSSGVTVGDRYRIVIHVKTGGGAFGYLYRNGDFTTPFDTFSWGTSGTQTELFLGDTVWNGTPAKVEYQNLVGGSLQPAVSTIISGGLIQTGKVQSTDEKTFFDLDNNIIEMNDNYDNTQLTLGNYTASKYSLRIARPGVDMDANTNSDDLLFNSDWAIPKYSSVFSSTPHNRAGELDFTTEPEMHQVTVNNDGQNASGTANIWVSSRAAHHGIIDGHANVSGGSGEWASATIFNDSTQSWVTNELVGMYAINHRMGGASSNYMYSGLEAFATVVSNTATQVTTTALTGGAPYGGYYPSGANGQKWNHWTLGSGGGDRYSLIPHNFGVLDTDDLGYYVGKRRIQSTYNFLHEPGVTVTTIPYLHDKNNKYLRLSCYLTESTVLRWGVYKSEFNTRNTPQPHLIPADLSPVDGDNGIWIQEGADFDGDSRFVNMGGFGSGVITYPRGIYFFSKQLADATTDYWSIQMTDSTSSTPYEATAQWYGDENHFNYFSYIKDSNMQKTHTTNDSTSSYIASTINMTTPTYTSLGLEHGEEYIIKVCGGRNGGTEYPMSNTDGTAGRHRIIMPKVTVHGYDFNAVGNNNST